MTKTLNPNWLFSYCSRVRHAMLSKLWNLSGAIGFHQNVRAAAALGSEFKKICLHLFWQAYYSNYCKISFSPKLSIGFLLFGSSNFNLFERFVFQMLIKRKTQNNLVIFSKKLYSICDLHFFWLRLYAMAIWPKLLHLDWLD